MPPNQTVSHTDFQGLKEDITEMKAMMGKVADALARMATLEERSQSTNKNLSRIVDRLDAIEQRQQTAAIEAAANRTVAQRLETLELSVRESHLESERMKASVKTTANLVRGLVASVAFVAPGIGFLVNKFI